MESLDWIEHLAASARQELPPATDLPVAPLLDACRAEQLRPRSLAIPAALSAAAAIIMLVLALHVGGSSSSSSSSADPIAPLFNAAQVPMP